METFGPLRVLALSMILSRVSLKFQCIVFPSLHGAHNSLHGALSSHNSLHGAHNLLHGAHNSLHGAHNSLHGAHNLLHGAHSSLHGTFNSLYNLAANDVVELVLCWYCCRDHVRLEQEKHQKEIDIKTRGSEMVTLQRELETLVATAKKLDAQRADAKKRLEELDKKVRCFMNVVVCILPRCRK